MKRYFITGTDTDCGKTYVSCQLLDYFRTSQQSALALKPLASGGYEDIEKLQQHNKQPNIVINRWKYSLAIAPHLAAREAEEEITADKIAEFCDNKAFEVFDNLLIEGAGGLMVPLNSQETWLDFLKITKIPVIIVVGMRLGCLNHALLTAAVLQAEQIACLGYITNNIDPNMQFLAENIACLSEFMPIPHIGTVPYRGIIDFK